MDQSGNRSSLRSVAERGSSEDNPTRWSFWDEKAKTQAGVSVATNEDCDVVESTCMVWSSAPIRPHQPFARVHRALKHRGAGMIGGCHIVEHLPSLTEWRMVDVMEIERE